LLVVCDDFGRFDARPAILRSRCFPLKLNTISDEDVSGWLANLIKAGLVWTYSTSGRTYLQVKTWGKHQQVRAQKSKYPEPKADDIKQDMLISDDINGNQALSDVLVTREALSESENESMGASAPPIENAEVSPESSSRKTKVPVPSGVIFYRSVIGRYPSKELYQKIDECIDKRRDAVFLRKCYEAWIARGWNPQNLEGWLFGWYANGAIEERQYGKATSNSNGQHAPPSDSRPDPVMAVRDREDRKAHREKYPGWDEV